MGKRWVAPPTWPQPPVGFVPEPGWRPDPSWPPAPAGWQFWQTDDDGNSAVERIPADAAIGHKPGLLERWKVSWQARQQARLERQRAQHAEESRRKYTDQLAAWTAKRDELQEALDLVRDFKGVSQSEVGGGFVLKRAEHGYALVRSVALIEARRAQGHYVGGYQGFSIKVTKGVRYHVGGTRGHYVPGPEDPTVIDEGDALITDQRVLFRGPKQSREWSFAKLIGYTVSEDRQWMALQVSNRQKVSGIGYGASIADLVEHRLELALATFQGRRDELAREVEAELAAHEGTKPKQPAALGSSSG